MARNVLEVFNQGCPDLKFDKAFVKKLHNYRQAFANKNEDHIGFFGGMLMGVHRVRFRTEDRNEWFDDILQADDLSLEDELHALDAIESQRHVSSDVMNLSCLWVVHRLYTSPSLSAKEKEEAMIDALLVLQYKFITSILARWFTYSADLQVAQATVAALSMRYGLKNSGSWGQLLHDRAVEILQGRIHLKTYTQFTNDEDIVYMVNDIQGRIKKILKNIRDVFERVRKDPKTLIRSNSAIVQLDGVTQVKDKKRQFVQYRRYLHSVITDPATFLKPELVDVIVSGMSALKKADLEQALYYMSVNYGANGDPDIEPLLEEALAHAFDYLATQGRNEVRNNDLAGLITKLKALYMASRGSDPAVMKMRDLGERIVQRSIRSKTPATIASVRTGLLLYSILRTFSMQHYSK